MEKGLLVFAPKTDKEPPAKKVKGNQSNQKAGDKEQGKQKGKQAAKGSVQKKGEKEGEGDEQQVEGAKDSDAHFVQHQYRSYRKLLLHLFHHHHEKIRVIIFPPFRPLYLIKFFLY